MKNIKTNNTRFIIQRDETYDIIRGIAIFFVVFGHCIQVGNGVEYIDNQMYFFDFFYKTIYMFHMPLLMYISGYFFFDSLKRHPKDVIVYKLKQCLIPIFTVGTIKLIYDIMLCETLVPISLLYFIFDNYYHSLWFLWSILVNTIFVFVLEKINNRRLIICYISFTFFVLFFTPDMLSSNMYKFMLPYFVAGFYVRKYHSDEVMKSFSSWMVLFFAILFLIMQYIYDFNCYIYTSGMSLIRNSKTIYWNQLIPDIIRYLSGVIGIVFIFFIVQGNYIKVKIIKKIFLLLGKNSLCIYIISTEFLNPILKIITSNCSYNIFRVLIETVSIIILCLSISWIIEKNKYIRLFVLGIPINKV